MDEFQHLDDHALLGVSSSASPDNIKQAYRREIAKYHPDRFRNADPQTQQYAQERSQRITEAYAALSRGARQRFRAQPPLERFGDSGSAGPSAASQLAQVYQQATARLSEGYVDEAIRLLQQIQRVDPTYRDVDELIAQAQSRRAVWGAARGGSRAQRQLWGLGGAVLAGLVVLGGAWGAGVLRSDPVAAPSADVVALASPPASGADSTPAPSAAASLVSTPAPAVVIAPTESAPPTESVPPPTESVPPPTESVPPPTESVPTATAVVPAAVLVPTPTALPTALAVPPTSIPAPQPAQPTPAPARRAVESGRALVSDSFNDPASGWPNIQAAAYTLGYRDGAYAITTQPGAGAIFAFGAPLAQGNVVLGADVTPVRGSAGMIFGPDNSYRFYVSGDGRFRVDARGKSLVPFTASNAIRRGTNRLVIAAAGQRASLYANGVLLTNLDLPSSLEGTTYGFVVLDGPRGGEGVFDSLTVRTLPR